MTGNFSDSDGGQTGHPPYPSFWQAVALICAMVAIQFLILIPVVAGGFRLTEEKDWWALAVEIPLLVLSTLGALGIAGTWPNANLSAVLRFPPLTWRGGIALAASIAGTYLLMEGLQYVQIYASAFHPWLKKQFADNPFSHLSFWPALVYLALFAPVCEEVLFRGVILGGFLRRYPAAKSLALSALLFAAIHLNISQLLGAFAAGYLLGWWRMRSGGLTAPILLHTGYNASALILSNGGVPGNLDFYYTRQSLLYSAGFIAAGLVVLYLVARFHTEAPPSAALPD